MGQLLRHKNWGQDLHRNMSPWWVLQTVGPSRTRPRPGAGGELVAQQYTETLLHYPLVSVSGRPNSGQSCLLRPSKHAELLKPHPCFTQSLWSLSVPPTPGKRSWPVRPSQAPGGHFICVNAIERRASKNRTRLVKQNRRFTCRGSWARPSASRFGLPSAFPVSQ